VIEGHKEDVPLNRLLNFIKEVASVKMVKVSVN